MTERNDLESIFQQALELDDTSQREAYLDEVCGDDVELRSELDRVLRSHDVAGSFLAGKSPNLNATEFVSGGRRNESVLGMFKEAIGDVPSIALRESQEQEEHIQRPSSPEIPATPADGRYQLPGEIARGGMGVVIKGRDTDLGRDLAVKVLLESHKDKPDVTQRFIEEAQIGGQLQHPGIAPVYELGQFEDQRPYFTMKLVKGKTLAALLASRTSLEEDRAKFIGIFEQVCQTVAYAHSRGVIHRDLKPANIMVGAFGEVQVMDWGLAKVLSSGGVNDEKFAHQTHQDRSVIATLRSSGSDTPVGFGSQTQMGSVMGTPAYMPPEQALGEIDQLDERGDVFSLGAILCEILTGKPPYVAKDSVALFRLATRAKLDDCHQRLEACEVETDLKVLTMSCLAAEPDDRPRDAGVLSNRVTQYLESVEARLREAEIDRAEQTVRANEERKRRRVSLALATAMLALVSAIGGGGYWIQLQAAVAAQQQSEASKAIAEKEQEKARQESEAKDILSRTLYASQINLAQSQRIAGVSSKASTTLEEIRSDDSLRRYIGFEWNYLKRQCGVPETDSAVSRISESFRRFRNHGKLGPHGINSYYRLLSADSSRVAAVLKDEQADALTLYVWDWNTGSEVMRRDLPFQETTLKESVRLSHNGDRVASAKHTDSGTEIQIWDVADSELVQSINISADQLNFAQIEITFVPDSDLVAVVKRAVVDGPVFPNFPEFSSILNVTSVDLSVWEIDSGKQRLQTRLKDSSGFANVLASPDGSKLAVVATPVESGTSVTLEKGAVGELTWRESIEIIDTETGELVQTLSGEPMLNSMWICFSLDSKRLASTHNSLQYPGAFAMLWIWDISTGTRSVARPATVNPNQPVQFSPDGNLVAVGNHEVQVFDSRTGAKVTGFSNPHGSRVRFSLDSASMVLPRSFDDDGGPCRWRVRNDIKTDANDSNRTVFSPDGKRKAWLVPGNNPEGAPELHVAEANGKELMTVEFHGKPVSKSSEFPRSGYLGWIQFQDNGSVLVGKFPYDCEDAKAREIVAWDVNSDELAPKLAGPQSDELEMKYVWPRQGAFYALKTRVSESGRRMGTTRELYDQMQVGNLKTGAVHRFSTDQKIRVVAFSNDGSLVAVSLASDASGDPQEESSDSLAVYRASDLVRVESIPITGDVKFVSFNADNQQIAVAKHDHTIEVWEWATQTRMFTHSGESQFSPYITSVPLFSPDGRRLLVCRMKQLQVFDVVSGQLMLEDDLGDVVMYHDRGYIGGTFIDDGNRVRLPTLRGTRILDATPIEDPGLQSSTEG